MTNSETRKSTQSIKPYRIGRNLFIIEFPTSSIRHLANGPLTKASHENHTVAAAMTSPNCVLMSVEI